MRLQHLAATLLLTGMASLAHAGSLTDCSSQTYTVPGGADYVCTSLTGADLTGANLTSANFSGADLTGATLTGSNLTAANFGKANLTDADLTGANLYGAIWAGANISGVNLTGSGHSSADLIALGAYVGAPVSAVPEADSVWLLMAGLSLTLLLARRRMAHGVNSASLMPVVAAEAFNVTLT